MSGRNEQKEGRRMRATSQLIGSILVVLCLTTQSVMGCASASDCGELMAIYSRTLSAYSSLSTDGQLDVDELFIRREQPLAVIRETAISLISSIDPDLHPPETPTIPSWSECSRAAVPDLLGALTRILYWTTQCWSPIVEDLEACDYNLDMFVSHFQDLCQDEDDRKKMKQSSSDEVQVVQLQFDPNAENFTAAFVQAIQEGVRSFKGADGGHIVGTDLYFDAEQLAELGNLSQEELRDIIDRMNLVIDDDGDGEDEEDDQE